MPGFGFSRRDVLGAAMGGGFAAGLAAPARAASPPDYGGGLSAKSLGLSPDASGLQTNAFARAARTASERGLPLLLEPGNYRLGRLVIEHPISLIGVPGYTVLRFEGDNAALAARTEGPVQLSGLVIDGAAAGKADGNAGLVHVSGAGTLHIERCLVRASPGHAIALERCAGAVAACEITEAGQTGIFSIDARGIEIGGNHVHDCANNGIQVWRSAPGEDGTLVARNRVERIHAEAGGSGQNGNGINVFRAGNVIVSNNRIVDCAFTAIRSNRGSNCQILGNSCARAGEVALYSEFAFEGVVIANNVVEEARAGISITNFNDGGRLAVCSGNIVRNLVLREPERHSYGIWVEADAAVTGNVVESVPHVGINLGWGRYLRDCLASDNVVRECGIGIGVSVVAGAGKALVANNLIARAGRAVVGMDHANAVTGDLARGSDDRAANVAVRGNLVT